MSASAMGLAAGVAASTMTRYLNDKSNTVGISQITLEKIEAYSGFSVFQMPGEKRMGFQEPDAIPYEAANSERSWIDQAIAAAKANNNNIFSYEMRGWVIDQNGIIPNDILIIDMACRPRSGDIVCAQVTDFHIGTADTIIRVYEPPYLLAHSTKLGIQKPLVVDEERIAIRGVMIGALRKRA